MGVAVHLPQVEITAPKGLPDMQAKAWAVYFSRVRSHSMTDVPLWQAALSVVATFVVAWFFGYWAGSRPCVHIDEKGRQP